MATAAPTLRIGPADHGRLMTIDEFLAAEEEEGYRYELARGVLEVTYVPGEPHALIVWFLLGRLRDYEREHPGEIFRAGGGGEFRLWLPGMISGRNPDIAVVLRNTPIDSVGDRPPTLAFEIVSKGADAHARDYEIKKQEYLAFGMREYWIVDRFERKVTVLRRRGDAWTEGVFRDGQAASGLVLPGFAVPVDDLWAAVAGVPDGEADRA